MKIKTSVAAFFTTLLSLAIIFFILLAPQSALAVGCTGAKCNGLNPSDNGCGADQKLISSVPLRDKSGVIELKYSPACQAYWGKLINTKNHAPIWISLYQQQAAQWVVIPSTTQSTTGFPGELFTNMWASFPANSCGYIDRSQQSKGKVWVCSKVVYSRPS